MKKNLSSVTLTAPVLSVRGVNGMASPQNNKKVQGFDKTSASQTFASKIEKLKDKPKKESLQGAYVSGLQDEIHYLQMQLKLLKDKEIAKRSQVDQLQTFFGDGIPINENILALKNGFNNYKSQLEKKISSLETEKRERQNIIVCLRAKVTDSVKKIHGQEKKYKQLLTSRSNITHDKVKKQTQIKHQIEVEEENLRNLKAENRRVSQNIAGMQRSKQLLQVSLLKIENNKFNKLNKLRESVAEKQKEFEELGKVYEQLKKQEDQKSYVINLEQANVALKRKIISLQKQFHALTIKIEQKEMELNAKLKQRHKQIVARVDMQKRVDTVKEAIQKQNNMSVEELDKIAMERQAKILETIIDRNKKLTQYVEHYGNILYKVEEHIYEMGERKPQLKRELQIYQNQNKGLEKTLEQEKNRHCELTSEIAKQTSKGQHINVIAPPTIKQITIEKDKINACKLQRERLKQDIKLKQKQLELMEILKCLNLEEAEISNSSNSSLQDRIMDFMQNWDTLYQNQ